MTTTAAVMNDPEYDGVARVERRRWRVAISDGRRCFKWTRREAVEWCEEMGLPYVVVNAPLRDRESV
jgi:hypothetical protein